jgi:hypothetical protein
MKKLLRVIFLTALATSAVWVIALVIVFWLFMRTSQQREPFIAYFTVPSHTKAPSALVLEQFTESRSGVHTEIFRSDIPPGEQRHFGLRVAQSSSSAAQIQ